MFAYFLLKRMGRTRSTTILALFWSEHSDMVDLTRPRTGSWLLVFINGSSYIGERSFLSRLRIPMAGKSKDRSSVWISRGLITTGSAPCPIARLAIFSRRPRSVTKLVSVIARTSFFIAIEFALIAISLMRRVQIFETNLHKRV